MLYKHNKWYIHHCWDDLRIQFKATTQVTQGKRIRLLCEWQEPATALRFSLGKVTYWGGAIFLLPASSSNFSISEPWHLSFLHTDLKQKGERRTWSDCDVLKHALKLGVYLLQNQTTRRRPLNTSIYLHLCCLGKRRKKKNKPKNFVPCVQTRHLRELPKFCLATKALCLYVDTSAAAVLVPSMPQPWYLERLHCGVRR